MHLDVFFANNKLKSQNGRLSKTIEELSQQRDEREELVELAEERAAARYAELVARNITLKAALGLVLLLLCAAMLGRWEEWSR